MLATIEDLHASDDLKSAKVTEIEQIQAYLTGNDFDRSEAVDAVARLQKKLVSLKKKSSIFNNISLSSHVAAMM
jgi:hypothetical protein